MRLNRLTPRRCRALPVCLAIAATLALTAAPARAGGDDDVDALIALVAKKPAKMDREQWLETRREAARKLGRLGDKKAVPVLIEIVKNETFDVIAEIAIDSLGRLRDKRAVPVLQAVIDDSSRDRYVRDEAKKALRRIGVTPRSGHAGGHGDEHPADRGDEHVRVPRGGSILGDDARHDVPAGPAMADDVIAASERLTFAAGDVALTYDTRRETTLLDGEVHARYDKVVEKRKLGFSYHGDGDLAFGVIDLPGDNSLSRAGALSLTGGGEARMFLGDGQLYAQAQLAAGASAIFLSQSIEIRRRPFSKLVSAPLEIPTALASSFCRMPFPLRTVRMRSASRRPWLTGITSFL